MKIFHWINCKLNIHSKRNHLRVNFATDQEETVSSLLIYRNEHCLIETKTMKTNTDVFLLITQNQQVH